MAGTKSSGARGRRGSPAIDKYLALIQAFPLKPVRTEAELDGAIAVLDALSDRESLSSDEYDYMLVLSGLVEKYEDEHHPMPSVTGVPILRYLIESKGVSRARVAAGVGIAESTLSEILSGRRKLGLGHVKALSAYFRVEPGLLIPD